MSSPKFFKRSDIADKIVIETTGKKIGKAKDLTFALDGSTRLLVGKDDSSEVEIPMGRIMGVADFIVVRIDAPQPAAKQAPQQRPAPAPARMQVQAPPPPMQPAAAPMGTTCRNCGSPLKPGAKFCTKCGTSTV